MSLNNLNNQLIGKDKYIEVVPNNLQYLIEDFTTLEGCFVFATKDTTYALTDAISSDYYSYQTYQGNNYIVFAQGFPINDYKQFKIIKPDELLSIPFNFNTVSSITPEALNRNFEAIKHIALTLQETLNNRVMRLDTTDGQVMLPELKPQQMWLKDTENVYKAISLDDFKELGETLITNYVDLLKDMLNTLYINARDNIIMTKNNSIKEMQDFLNIILSETENFTEAQKGEISDIVTTYKAELTKLQQDIIDEGTKQKGIVEDEGTKQLEAIKAVGVTAVIEEGKKQVNLVTQQGDKQIALVNAQGSKELEKIIETGIDSKLDKGDYTGNAGDLKRDVDYSANTKQNKTDNGLFTDDKTVVGAINEVMPWKFNQIFSEHFFHNLHKLTEGVYGVYEHAFPENYLTEHPDNWTFKDVRCANGSGDISLFRFSGQNGRFLSNDFEALTLWQTWLVASASSIDLKQYGKGRYFIQGTAYGYDPHYTTRHCMFSLMWSYGDSGVLDQVILAGGNFMPAMYLSLNNGVISLKGLQNHSLQSVKITRVMY